MNVFYNGIERLEGVRNSVSIACQNAFWLEHANWVCEEVQKEVCVKSTCIVHAYTRDAAWTEMVVSSRVISTTSASPESLLDASTHFVGADC